MSGLYFPVLTNLIQNPVQFIDCSRKGTLELIRASNYAKRGTCFNMTTEKNKEVVKNFIDRVWSRGLVDEIPDFIAPEYEAIGLATDVRVKGIEGVRENVLTTRSGYPDLRIEIDDMIAEKDRVASRLRLRGTPVHQQATTWARGALTNRELIFHQLKDGKITRAWSIASTWR